MFNFNTSPTLFGNLLKSEPNTQLRLVNGHIFDARHDCLARFDNNAKAKDCLIEAGFRAYHNGESGITLFKK